MEYQKQMLSLHLKANPKEVLVGWYATSSELNTFSALIQNFYGGHGDGTWPHPAVHLTVSTEPGKDIVTRTYISAPVGVTTERAADSAAFIPVPYEIRYGDAEKNGLEAIAAARDREDRATNLFTDIDSLERSIEEVIGMIDRVSRYVESVMDEEAPASTALGQFLLNALALAPKVDAAEIESDLYVLKFFILLFYLQSRTIKTNPLTVTNTSRTSLWSHTLLTPFVHKWSFPTGLQLPSLPLEEAVRVMRLEATLENPVVSAVTDPTEVEVANEVVLKPRSCELKEKRDSRQNVLHLYQVSPVLTVVMELAGRSINLLLESCFTSVVGKRRRLWSYDCIMSMINGAF